MFCYFYLLASPDSLHSVVMMRLPTPQSAPQPGAQSSRSSSSRSGGGMECGVAAPGGFSRPHPPHPPHPSHPQHPALSPTERSPAKAGLHVNFSDKGEVKERREKFLTAKYGSHQMALIRKRLAVEMWLYDELQKLYEVPSEAAAGAGAAAGASTEVEVDIDELLDMDSDDLRRRHLTTLLAEAKKPQKDVHVRVPLVLLCIHCELARAE
ncbi:unnamed protein product [Danaus chrysippus]|uniref:(African queen) hypothetical protein n=1 Tax=Danaus chrysippus TaxID=151541 RepID=A0A8J2WAN6_9NEOP|nr:unnamed protein product [Danaus chrysippus]